MKNINCRECQQPICEHIQKWQNKAVNKLKRRGIQIADLKHRIKELQELQQNTEKFLVSTFGSDKLGFIQRQVGELRQKKEDLYNMNQMFKKEIEGINKQHGF